MGRKPEKRRRSDELADVLTAISVVARRLAKSARIGSSPPRTVSEGACWKTHRRRCK